MKNKYYFGIFLISAATLMLEIGLIRLLSVMQFYHFAFLVVSIALFGIAAAGTFFYIKKLKNPVYLSAILFSIATIIGFLLFNSLPFDPIKASVNYIHSIRLICYYVFLGSPFFFSGIIIAYFFSKYQKLSGKIYFSNLSGAAIGSVGILPLISMFGERIIIMISIIGLISSIFFIKRLKNIYCILLLIIILLFIPIKLNISDYKELPKALNYPNAELLENKWNSFSRVDIIKSSFIRYAPGLSSQYSAELPEQIGVLTDAANMNAITNYKNIDFLNYLPSAIGYSLLDKPKTLVINAGAGLDVLTALYNNASITAVESNQIIVDFLKGKYKEFSGDVYNKVDVEIGNVRSIIKKKKKYDLVIVSLDGNVIRPTYGFSENYLLTVEAFKDYYNSLTEDGIIVITRFLSYPPMESLRLFSIALEVDSSAKKIAMFRSWTTVTLVLGKKEFDENRINRTKNFIEKNRFDTIYLPAKFEPNKYAKFKEPYYYEGVKELLDNKNNFFEYYLFNVKPVYDDKPFYFNFFKLSKVKELYEIIGEGWQPFLDAGFLLIFLLIQASILSIIFILLPLKYFKNIKIKENSLVFFFFIGIAYIFIEMVFIQKFILLFGQVVYSVVLVIFSMLLFSSLGSLYSQKLKTKNITKIIYIIFFMLVIYYFLISRIIGSLIILNVLPKIILSALIIAPLAFVMGMPFPLGIRFINKKYIPWAWAVNGSASVLSSIIVILIAIFFGYSIVLVLGGFSYLGGIFFLRK